MIHRIDRVNPDVDDRVIKPNEARMAKNLRFGASTEDTNLSGGTLVLGNKKVVFEPPLGDNKVVGVYSDLATRNVFFALYNSNGGHGIYRISSEDVLVNQQVFQNKVERVIGHPNLNFQPDDDYNVCMVVAGGDLYWTDNVNEPRVVNIEKGIRTQAGQLVDVYPPAWKDWYYSQIKRPPGAPLFVQPYNFTPEQISKTDLNQTQVELGLQYSYYYIYDGGKESRLAPFSKISYANYNVKLGFDTTEFLRYISNREIIKEIIIVVRQGNDGVWRQLLSLKNNPIQIPSFIIPTISNVLTAIKGPIPSDITEARYDSVPLLSKTMEVAQNRLNHANYTLDRFFDGITIEAKIDYAENIINASSNPVATRGLFVSAQQFQTHSFIPWGRYAIGVEFVDEYGRTFPVSKTVDVIAPHTQQSWQNGQGSYFILNNRYVPLFYQNNNEGSLSIIKYSQNSRIYTSFGDSRTDFAWQFLYGLVCEYKIRLTQPLPSWVKYVNVVRSKSKNIVKMIQSVGNALLWYDSESGIASPTSLVQQQLQNYTYADSAIPNVIFDTNSPNVKYTFMGYIITFNPAETPIVYEDGMYITLCQMYNYRDTSNFSIFNTNNSNYFNTPASNQDVAWLGPMAKFKVHGIIGNQIYIRASDPISISNPNNLTQIGPLNPNQRIIMTPYSFATTVQSNGVTTPQTATDETKSILLTYSFTITVEKNIDDQVVYTNQVYSSDLFNNLISTSPTSELIDYLAGDGYTCLANKKMPAMAYECSIYAGGTSGQGSLYASNKKIRTSAYNWTAMFFSMSPRDIYDEKWNQDIGQLNTTDYTPSQPQRLENAICFSAPFIQGTQTNGLNKFNSLDFRQAPAENGSITSLVVTNAAQKEPGVMLAIGTYGISSFYYDAIQLTNVDGSSNVATTNTYLGSQRPLLGQFGCKKQTSITKTPLGTVYWWSEVVNDLIRYTNAGLERLGLTFSFSNYLRNNYGKDPMLITWYDQVTDEVNLSGKFVYETATFSERYKTFQGERQYFELIGSVGTIQQAITPERAISVPTKNYHFIQGNIWVTDVNDVGIPKNFIFGAYRNPDIFIVTNESPAIVKKWNQVKIFGSRPISTSLECKIDDGTSLTSTISPSFYISRKGDWEAAIRRADNTVGGLMAGKLMESRIIYSKFAWNADALSADPFTKLNFIEVKSNVSIVQ